MVGKKDGGQAQLRICGMQLKKHDTRQGEGKYGYNVHGNHTKNKGDWCTSV